MPGQRKAKLVAKETISNATSQLLPAGNKATNPEDETELMPPPRQKKRTVPVSSSRSKPLCEIILQGKADMQTVAADWVEVYKKDRDQGLLEMFQFFISASGCRGVITPDMQANMEFAEIIRKMTEEFDEDSAEYPLITSGPQWKKFRSNLGDFMQAVIKQCGSSFVFDGYLIDTLSSFLTGLTDSQVRAFRHTSTLLTMKLMTGLVDLTVFVENAKENATQQFDTERAKHTSRKASDRLQALENKKKELTLNNTDLLNMLNYIFRGVFVFRYRDIVPDIRSICMHEIGVWIGKLPSLYLEDSYLKYLGWTLFDKVAEVRLTCVRAIQTLYEMESYESRLELFTHRFKDRIVEMTLDKEFDVGIAAVRLMLSITKKNSSVITIRDAENVYELVFSSNRGVAQAAAEFLNYKMFTGDEDLESSGIRRRGGEFNSNYTHLKTLVQFFHESELHEHAAYVVDALWDINPMLKDWNAMSDLLLDESITRDEPLTRIQEQKLIDIMSCCCHQACTGEYPVGRGPATRKLTGKESKQARDDKFDMTEHFIESLPNLLAKYSSDEEDVVSLLKIALNFDLEVYTTSRKEKHLTALLDILKDIIGKSTNQKILDTCMEVVDYFSSPDYAISAKVDVTRSVIFDRILDNYKTSWLQVNEENDMSDEAVYKLYSTTKRLQSFSAIHNVSSTTVFDVWESLTRCLRNAQNTPDEIVVATMVITSNCLMWSLHDVSSKSPDKSAVKTLRKKTNTFMKLLQELLLPASPRVVSMAFSCICDILVLYNRHLSQLFPLLDSLVYEANDNLQSQLRSYLNDFIFTTQDVSMDVDDDTDKIEEIHSKRKLLAAFCKLIIYNILPITNAVDIFKNYIKFHDDYGDIIKSTLTKCREISKVQTAQTLAMALTKLYEELAEDNQGKLSHEDSNFVLIKDLARRFSLTFGFDNAKNRDAVAALHKKGIDFSLRKNAQSPLIVPNNLNFLYILCEFVSRLIRQDKKTMCGYLDKHIQHLPPHQGDEWAALNGYRNMLVSDDDSRSIASTSVSRPRARKPRTPANKQAGVYTSTAVKKKGAVIDDDVVSMSASISALSTGSDKTSDDGDSYRGSQTSQNKRPRNHKMMLAAPSELLPEGAEGAEGNDLEDFLME